MNHPLDLPRDCLHIIWLRGETRGKNKLKTYVAVSGVKVFIVTFVKAMDSILFSLLIKYSSFINRRVYFLRFDKK